MPNKCALFFKRKKSKLMHFSKKIIFLPGITQISLKFNILKEENPSFKSMYKFAWGFLFLRNSGGHKNAPNTSKFNTNLLMNEAAASSTTTKTRIYIISQ